MNRMNDNIEYDDNSYYLDPIKSYQNNEENSLVENSESRLNITNDSVLNNYPFLRINRDNSNFDINQSEANLERKSSKNNIITYSINKKPKMPEYSSYLANSRPPSHYQNKLNKIIRSDHKLPEINQVRKPIRFNNPSKNAKQPLKFLKNDDGLTQNSKETVIHHHHYYNYGDSKRNLVENQSIPNIEKQNYYSPRGSPLNYYSPRPSPNYYASIASPVYYTTVPSTYYGDQQYTSYDFDNSYNFSTQMLPPVNYKQKYPNYSLNEFNDNFTRRSKNELHRTRSLNQNNLNRAYMRNYEGNYSYF